MSKFIWRNTFIAAGLAAVLNAIWFLIGRGFDVSYQVLNMPMAEVTLLPVIFASAVPLIIGGIGYWGVSRLVEQPSRLFMWGAALIGLASFLPVYQAAADGGTFVFLGIMHVIATSVVIFWLTVRDQEEQVKPA